MGVAAGLHAWQPLLASGPDNTPMLGMPHTHSPTLAFATLDMIIP